MCSQVRVSSRLVKLSSWPGVVLAWLVYLCGCAVHDSGNGVRIKLSVFCVAVGVAGVAVSMDALAVDGVSNAAGVRSRWCCQRNGRRSLRTSQCSCQSSRRACQCGEAPSCSAPVEDCHLRYEYMATNGNTHRYAYDNSFTRQRAGSTLLDQQLTCTATTPSCTSNNSGFTWLSVGIPWLHQRQ